MGYFCNECKTGFDEPIVAKWQEKSECWGAPAYEDMQELSCPHCGGTDIGEADECLCCHDYIKADNELCDDCWKKFQHEMEAVQTKFRLDWDQFQNIVEQYFGW